MEKQGATIQLPAFAMKKPILYKFLIVALPAGLILLGGLSLVWHLRNPRALDKVPENQPKAKAVTRTDLEFYVKRLANDLGARPATDLAKSRQTAAFIEGTLGASNMGYLKVSREPFQLNGTEAVNISVELSGITKPEEIILVGASYDSAPDSAGANDNGTGVAATLALANLFMGTTPGRTVKFYFFANGHGPSPTGAETLASFSQRRGEKIVAMWNLDSLGHFNSAPGSQQPWPGVTPPLPDKADFIAFAGPASTTELLEQYRARYNTDASATAELVLTENSEGPDANAFSKAGFPAVRITDTGRYRYNGIDIPEAVHFEKFTSVVQALGRMLKEASTVK